MASARAFRYRRALDLRHLHSGDDSRRAADLPRGSGPENSVVPACICRGFSGHAPCKPAAHAFNVGGNLECSCRGFHRRVAALAACVMTSGLKALLEDAAAIDLKARGRIRVTGEDAARL